MRSLHQKRLGLDLIDYIIPDVNCDSLRWPSAYVF